MWQYVDMQQYLTIFGGNMQALGAERFPLIGNWSFLPKFHPKIWNFMVDLQDFSEILYRIGIPYVHQISMPVFILEKNSHWANICSANILLTVKIPQTHQNDVRFGFLSNT